jgi:hypothetical protein
MGIVDTDRVRKTNYFSFILKCDSITKNERKESINVAPLFKRSYKKW